MTRKLLRGCLVLVGIWYVAVLLWMFWQRVSYPLDLEWMEGGTLIHALRLAQGQGIYVAPSLEFIPFPYTPLYPAFLATLGQIFGISYWVGRLLSIGCVIGTLSLVACVVRREGGSSILALVAVAAAAACFPLVDGFYDLVRVDSLHLLLIVGGLYVLRYQHQTATGVAWAAVLLALAFWAKQTALPFIAAGALALVFLNRRQIWIYLLVVAIVDGLGVVIANHASEGWFWRTTFGIHQQHAIYWQRALWKGQWHMLQAAPLLVASPILWLFLRWRRAAQGARFWAWMALVGVQTSALAFSTQWAAKNAFMPSYVLCGLFLAVGITDLIRQKGRLVYDLGLIAQLGWLLYSPTRYVPTQTQHKSAEHFVSFLRDLSAKGPILVPYHPYYPVLVGQTPHFHHMGVKDLVAAGQRVPADIQDALTNRRFATIVMDQDGHSRYYGSWLTQYRRFALDKKNRPPRTWSGFRTQPRWLFESSR